jgi:acyl-coenzyme A synthetase/AMP-(fatty) acid ligase
MEESILEFANDQLDDVEKLRAGIRIVNQIPRNPTGKVQRYLMTIE